MSKKTSKPLSGREAILAVLRSEGAPMRSRDVIEKALALTGGRLKGATPKATLSAQIHYIVKKGLAVRPEKGLIALAPQGAGATDPEPEPTKKPAAKKAPPKKPASRSRPPKADASG